MDNAQNIISILVSLGVSGIIVAVINGILNRRKLGADATKVLTDAAVGLVASLKTRVEDLEEHERARDRRERLRDRALRRHEEWDRQVMIAVRKAKISVPDPPPLHIEEP